HDSQLLRIHSHARRNQDGRIQSTVRTSVAATQDCQGSTSLPWTGKLLQTLHSRILHNRGTPHSLDQEGSTLSVDNPGRGCIHLLEALFYNRTDTSNIQSSGTSHP